MLQGRRINLTDNSIAPGLYSLNWWTPKFATQPRYVVMQEGDENTETIN